MIALAFTTSGIHPGRQPRNRGGLQRQEFPAVVLLLLFFFAPALLAQQKPTFLNLEGTIILSGKAGRERGRLLAATVVYLRAARGIFGRQSRCGPDGRFTFKRIPPGLYHITARVGVQAQIERSIEITPSFADKFGNVKLNIEVGEESSRLPPGDPARTVSVRQLSIPLEAREEYRKAVAAGSRGDMQEMLRHLKGAIERAPDYLEALNHLGIYYYQTGAYGTAALLFQKAAKVDPGVFEPQVNLGGALLGAGQLEEAVAANRRALELRPDDALANAQLGITLFRLGQDDEALERLSAAKQADPAAGSNPQLFLADLHARRGNSAAAIAELEDFLARHPDSPDRDPLKSRIEALRTERK